jgi:hypothetical protein
MRRGVDTLAMGVLCAAFAGALAAQSTDAPRAPRIIDGAPAQPPAAPAADSPVPVTAPLILPTPTLGFGVRPPNAARLAPLPEERQDTPDEIIVIGQGWRLPDLGSEWRKRQQEAAKDVGRFSATALPLYDPAEPPLHGEVFSSPEQRRHGYIELFRLRFGRRQRADDDERDDQ